MKRLLSLILCLGILGGCSGARSMEVFIDESNRLYARQTTAMRAVSPVGVSPGETISRVQPATIETSAVSFTGSGGKWSIWDTIWQRLKDWAWIGLLAVVVLLLLPVFVPAVGPVISLIGQSFAKVVLWIIPVIGGLVEAIRRRSTVKVAGELVESQEAFKARLAGSDFDQATKEKVLKILKEANRQQQSDKAEALVRTIKHE